MTHDDAADEPILPDLRRQNRAFWFSLAAAVIGRAQGADDPTARFGVDRARAFLADPEKWAARRRLSILAGRRPDWLDREGRAAMARGWQFSG